MTTEVQCRLSCTKSRDQTSERARKCVYILTHVVKLLLVCILEHGADRQGYYEGHCIRDTVSELAFHSSPVSWSYSSTKYTRAKQVTVVYEAAVEINHYIIQECQMHIEKVQVE